MRSISPMPASGWPHDMVIAVDDRPHVLMDLLWLREAYGLAPTGQDLPPLLEDTPPAARGSSAAQAPRAQWEQAWPAIWRAAVAHAGQEADRHLTDRLMHTGDGSTRRAELLARLVGPTGRDVFGEETFDDPSLREWHQSGMEAHLARIRERGRVIPEHRDLEALVPAWRAGLTRIITIPCAGVFTRRVGQNAMLTTSRVRDESGSYRAALAAFL